MKILLLGKNGQLGYELRRTLPTLGQVAACDFTEVDLAQPENIRPVIREVRPQIIINASAYTAVDKAESEPEPAYAINRDAPAIMAEEARKLGAVLIHFSTDYVFDGTKKAAYTEQDTPNPLNMYGRSKLEGEQAILASGATALVWRTSWVYSTRRASFVTKVLQWARQQTSLRVVTDQISGPTWCRALAEVTAQVLARSGEAAHEWLSERSGLYHVAGDGYCSRFEWTQAILDLDADKETQTVKELIPATTAEFPSPAERPLFSALNCDRFAQTFQLRLPAWQDALRLAMEKTD